MRTCLRGILVVGLAATLLACAASVAGARTVYFTSKPATSNAPKKDRPFVVSGYITPKSTASNRATVEIILWMKYGTVWRVMQRDYWAKLSPRTAGGTRYAVAITIPMKGDHGVQAVQYRKGKKVSQSARTYFSVQP